MNRSLEKAQKILIDRIAFEKFYRTHVSPLRRYISSKVGFSEDVEEVLQDTFFSFLESIRDYRGEASLKTFLYSIGRNKIIDYYRRKKVKSMVFSQMPRLESLVSTLFAPEEKLEETLLREKIHHTMTNILPRYREILLCKYDLGMTVEAIAKKFSLTFKSTESRLLRARRAFTKAYARI